MAAGSEIKQILALIQPQMQRVEDSIRRQADAFDPAIQGYVSYACETTGKRLRPALALLTAGATGEIADRHERLAVIMELIHLATLIHDDILDGAEKRRDQPTANARWGNHITVLLGDCLFAHALDIATDFDDAEISRRIARAASAVCTGEILQTQRRFDLNLSLADYYRIIEMKTAALFGASAELGAALNKMPPEICAGMKAYGLRLGTAYQIYDDLLDLAGDEESAGKTLGTDLKKGKLTLPVLQLLQMVPEDEHGRLTKIILRGSDDDLAALSEAVYRSGTLQSAALIAREMIDDAARQLDLLAPSDHREALLAVGRRLGGMIDQLVD
jgi:octaprenyl-diphosphate synthase